MVVLTTGHTTTTGVLAVLANTTVTGTHMATVCVRGKLAVVLFHIDSDMAAVWSQNVNLGRDAVLIPNRGAMARSQARRFGQL